MWIEKIINGKPLVGKLKFNKRWIVDTSLLSKFEEQSTDDLFYGKEWISNEIEISDPQTNENHKAKLFITFHNDLNNWTFFIHFKDNLINKITEIFSLEEV